MTTQSTREKGFVKNEMKMYCGLYYKRVTIVNYASNGVNKFKASLNDDTRVVIYDHHMFIVQATGRTLKLKTTPILSGLEPWNFN
jgi:hypothetical protein